MKKAALIITFIPLSILWGLVGLFIGFTVPAQPLIKAHKAKREKAMAEETEVLLEKQIEVTLKLDKETEALKTDLEYARALLREVLDNANEYSRQNAEDFLANAEARK